MPTMGTRRTWANVLAASTPTRNPVYKPGPTPTATPPRWCRSIPVHPSSRSTAGTTSSCLRTPANCMAPTTSPRDHSATDVWLVDVSIPRTIIGRPSGPPVRSRSDLPWIHGSLEPFPPHPPCVTRAQDADRAFVARARDRELDDQVALGQEGLDDVPPLDQEHTVLGRLLQVQVDDVLHPLEPVDVGVHDRQAPRTVLPYQGERGRQDDSFEPDPPGQALRERR